MSKTRLLSRLLRAKNFKEIAIIVVCAVFVACLANPKIFNLNAFSVSNVSSKVIEGKVVRVIDGDTVEVLDKFKNKHRIRLYGIDAPESKQDYGQKAREFLASLIASKDVKVLITGTDRYSRNIGKIVFDDKDINAEMVLQGFAWAYEEYSTDYVKFQAYAKEHKLGLWQDKHPTKPSEFRKNQRK